MPLAIHTVAMYPRPHPDNIVALWLLREFGEPLFPGIGQAKIVFWNQLPDGRTADQLEQEGVLLIDLGGGRFDHHHDEHISDKQTCATTLVAKFLGVDQRPELKKLLEYVRRDDLEGRGIVSKDPIDRAFGLSAIVMNLNRAYPDHPEYVIDMVTRIVIAHYHEEYRRKVLMPKEWVELQRTNKAQRFELTAAGETLQVVMVETDSKAMVGFLRAVGDVKADVVVQRLSTGHTNIVTRQAAPRLDLRPTIAAIRLAEAEKKGFNLSQASREQLEKPRRLEGVEEWYFDTAANTLQNGGVATSNVMPTRLSLAEIRSILERALPGSLSTRPVQPSPPSAPYLIKFSDLRRRTPPTRRAAPPVALPPLSRPS
ncbi:MAG: hypothetical protein HYY50_04950 [Candidatus Kerfeldbacteria bacterium]|nr:hypothetical protein [Candidatus Kerfeldbacteria bacterium]